MKYIVMLFTLSLAFNAFSAEIPGKASMQTKAGLYVDAREAYELQNQPDGRKVVLIDVRDPVEIKFTGYTDKTDIHVPWKIIDTEIWDEKKQSYGGYINKDFAEEVISRLDALGVGKDAHLIFMCRSGSTRSAPAADALYANGFSNVYSMVDGFEGTKAKDGLHKSARVIDGWKNAGLPWGWKLEKGVMYGISR
jgi:rhodanese-related sulfurtransferase